MDETTESGAELVVRNARIWTQDPERPWATALAVRGGSLVAVGADEEVAGHVGADTEVVDLDGAMVMPGLSEGHVHLGLGGAQAAFELPLLPTDGLDDVLAKVRDWASRLGPDDWVVGGIVGATLLDTLADRRFLQLLDEASGGRPVLLRDDSMHNRWVSSRTLELMGVGPSTPDPEGGRYVRDAEGHLTGLLYELTSSVAESAFAASIPDKRTRTRTAVATAVQVLNSYGITAAQDAATMGLAYAMLRDLEDAGELTARVVTSAPVRQFLEEGTTGDELIAEVRARPGTIVRPDFVKVVLDGVPMTRTTALLEPYLCSHGQTDTTGEIYWTLEDLVAQVERCYDLGMGAKFHATGDASVRLVLDAVEQVRGERGPGPLFQIAHVEFIHPDDVPRFGALGVVADASPFIWFPSVLQESIQQQVPGELVAASWPFRSLLDSGAAVAGGSDWPCSAPTPDPWTGLQTMVTRRSPDPSIEGSLNPGQAITLEEAITAFTSAPAEAMGLGEVTGRLTSGRSADFIVLDRHLFEVDIAQVHATRVLRTYFAGRLVHTAADGTSPEAVAATGQ
ncbi:amidohydrolase [Modestobacter sp. VKM Ac-2979]|uniref:amidohydrolase n=1 Tax=unclassified Modestobacter TaxID=2643866 RepID=UPI0022AB60E1|nr:MULTISPECIES: amidohydrolase [unclassified Modestobacter]MCZ2811653.1 amidohydrolase [Modestobacter sp. VKM Ac-2979]MCZ2843376.1 amidohydrolase [Modestobacter sp. VKM Ac-2980]